MHAYASELFEVGLCIHEPIMCVYPIPISPFYPNMHGPSWAHVCNVFIAHDQNFFWKIF